MTSEVNLDCQIKASLAKQHIGEMTMKTISSLDLFDTNDTIMSIHSVLVVIRYCLFLS